jgi:hypothetical protein
MRLSHTARAATVVVALLTVFVAGCDEDDGPTSPPSTDSPSVPESSSPATETSTPPSTAAGPVEPTLPSDAGANSRQGVEAFVRFYWDVVNYATKTGDIELLGQLHQPSCHTCDAGITGIDRVYQRGGRIVGGSYAVVRLQPVRSPSGQWAVVTHTRVGAQRAIGAGNLNRTYPAGTDTWLIGIARVGGNWSIASLEAQ